MKNYSQNFLILLLLHLQIAATLQAHHSGPILLYSTQKDIRTVNTSRSANSKLKSVVIVQNFHYINVVDYHYEKKKIFWADHEDETIQSITYNGPDAENKDKVKIIERGLSPDGLACDWFTNKIYWTDSNLNRIEVATLEGKDRKVLFWTDLDQPRAIAVAPMKGLLFWTDWGETPKIERAGMNGDPATRKVLVQDKIFWPNGLSLDYESELVYWVDAKLLFIKVMDFDGKNMTSILSSGLEYPFALTHIRNKIYWTDWKSLSIHYYDKSSSQKPTELIHLDDNNLMDVHVWDPQRQPKGNNPCAKNNGGCSHLCLLAPDPPYYSCSCGIGVKLIDKYNCSKGPQELLLLARRTDICLIYLDTPDYSYKVLPFSDVKYSIAVDYDPVKEFIYWSDNEVKKIQRARLNGSDEQDFITSEIQDPDGITIDWISRNIYWTDTGTDRIEVVRLEKPNFRKVIISDGLLDPRGIAVAPELGWLFWSDWNEKKPKIERSNLDGSERILIVSENLGWPNGITLDLDNRKIYWCDAKVDRIEYSNMDGTNRLALISDNVPHVFGFSLMGDYVYWTDWQRRSIERAHKESGTQREVIIEQMENVMGLKAIKLFPKATGWNPCKENNGNCSQLCLYRHNKTRVCACQIDYELQSDKTTCVIPNSFLLFAKKDNIGRISIENENTDVTIPIPGIKQANSIDFYTNRVYWADTRLKTIMRSFINGSDPQKVIDTGLASLEAVAVDWLGLNLYWTDPVAHRIEVARLVGTSRRTLIWDAVYEPRSLVLDPVAGYMYWSEWGTASTSTVIKRASMDGQDQKELTKTSGNATGLGLDYDKRRLYWVVPSSSTIMSSNLDGNDKIVVLSGQKYFPYTLALYRDYIYFNDEKTGDIIRIDQSNIHNVRKIHSLNGTVTDLLVFHTDKQRQMTNQCATSNAGCTNLCLALPGTGKEYGMRYKCACPTHFILQKNECVPPTDFMIYSQRNLAVRLLPDTSDCPEAVLPIQGLKAVKAIDYDPKNNFLYWIDHKSRSIKRSAANGSQMDVIVTSNPDLQPIDLAIDPIGRLLFWTCQKQNIINVTRLDNPIVFGSLDKWEGEKPKLLSLHHKKRLLFYTDVGSNATTHLVRRRLDGSQKIVIASAPEISLVAVDSEHVIWTQGPHTIHMSNIDGENNHAVFNEAKSKISQLTIYSGWIYWIDREVHELNSMQIESAARRPPLSIQTSHVNDLISVQNLDNNHSCNMPHQKKCSHFCILSDNNPVCACPSGKMLQEDKRSCVALPNCGSDRFTCTQSNLDSKDCIPMAWRCDMQPDCVDGSDEMDCPSCKANQFKCQDGHCIDSSLVCDNFPNCPDKSDEKNCCKDGFQCPQTEVCLHPSVVCDSIENCADGSDENPALCDSRNSKKPTNIVILVIAVIVSIFGFISFVMYCQKKKFKTIEDATDQSEDSLSPMHPGSHNKMQKLRKGIPDVVSMSMMNDSCSTYDRRHITGASSSSNTNGSSVACYPRETLNPPPSPATTAASTRGSSPSSHYRRPYKHYRSINQPPPPTPCSTDICDESDYNYPTRRYDGTPFPPPPTPRSHCHNESCPPSPSSRSSTYFSPLPPPPSPVASPRGYDS